MTVFINNEKREIPLTNILKLLSEEVKLPSVKGVAIAINNQVIPKSEWENYSIQENDKITIIRATQGG